MISKAQIENLANAFLQGSDNYLIDVKVSASNKIVIHIENDSHVAIRDCVALSRHIEHSLDREKEDFELEVSSPGIDQPFKHPRQYRKYQGKEVDVKKLNGDQLKGILIESDDSGLTLQPSPTKKSKKTAPQDNQPQTISIPFSDVKEARLIIKF